MLTTPTCSKIGLSLGWVYLFMGVIIGSAVPPIAFCITWDKISATGAISGAVAGLCGAILTWVLTAKGLTGVVTIDSLGGDFPMLAGNVVAIGLSAVVCIVVSLIKPQNFDWALMKEIPMVEHDEAAFAADGAVRGAACWVLVVAVLWAVTCLRACVCCKPRDKGRAGGGRDACTIGLGSPQRLYDTHDNMPVLCWCLIPLAASAPQDSPAALTKALKWTYITGGTLTVVLLILWPILALPAGVFSQGYFTMWIVVSTMLQLPNLNSPAVVQPFSHF